MLNPGRTEGGFTLVEVLVVTVIIGTLAALAIPIFAVYKAQAFNSKANVDLKNIITAEEANFDGTDNYVSCGPSDCSAVLPAFAASSGVQVNVDVSGSYFSVASCHIAGDKVFTWDSYSGVYSITSFTGTCDPVPPALP